MRKILVLFAHPRFEHSVVNKAIISPVSGIPGVTFHDLYEKYPDFNIDVKFEQQLLLEHDVIIWHHPFYWYSCPPLLKQWIDLVLEFNWAYGPAGDKLSGKFAMNVITTGGNSDAYREGGRNRFKLNQLLTPFDQTAYLCRMQYLPPFAVQGTHRLSKDELLDHAGDYARLLSFLTDENNSPELLQKRETANEFVKENLNYGK